MYQESVRMFRKENSPHAQVYYVAAKIDPKTSLNTFHQVRTEGTGKCVPGTGKSSKKLQRLNTKSNFSDDSKYSLLVTKGKNLFESKTIMKSKSSYPRETNNSLDHIPKHEVPPVSESQSSVVSSNSVEESSILKKLREKQQQSKRFVWPKELHQDFSSAIFSLGLERCNPLSILLQINKGGGNVTMEEVKSYLNSYKKRMQTDIRPGFASFSNIESPDSVEAQKLIENETPTNDESELKPKSILQESPSMMSSPGFQTPRIDNDSSTLESNSPKSPVIKSRDVETPAAVSSKYVEKNNVEFIKPKYSAMKEKSPLYLGHLVLPALSDVEKNSSMGASMVFLMGLYYSLEQELQKKRKDEAAAAYTKSKIVAEESKGLYSSGITDIKENGRRVSLTIDDSEKSMYSRGQYFQEDETDTQRNEFQPKIDDEATDDTDEFNHTGDFMMKYVSKINTFISSGNDDPCLEELEKQNSDIDIEKYNSGNRKFRVIQDAFHNSFPSEDLSCKKRVTYASDDIVYTNKRPKCDQGSCERDFVTDNDRTSQMDDVQVKKEVDNRTCILKSCIVSAQVKLSKLETDTSPVKGHVYHSEARRISDSTSDHETRRIRSKKNSIPSRRQPLYQEHQQYLDHGEYESLQREEVGSIADVSDFEGTCCDDDDSLSTTSSVGLLMDISHEHDKTLGGNQFIVEDCTAVEECTADMDADTIYRYLLEDST